MSKNSRGFYECPRCGEAGLEKFSSHHYCVNCNYDSEDKNLRRTDDSAWAIPMWVYSLLKTTKPKSIIKELIEDNKILPGLAAT